jgi:hypothetical protein
MRNWMRGDWKENFISLYHIEFCNNASVLQQSSGDVRVVLEGRGGTRHYSIFSLMESFSCRSMLP